MSDKVLIDRDLLKELVSSLEDEVESRYSNGIKEHPAIKRYYKCDIEPVIRGKELLAAAPAAPVVKAEPVATVVERNEGSRTWFEGVIHATAIVMEQIKDGDSLYAAPPAHPDAALAGENKRLRKQLLAWANDINWAATHAGCLAKFAAITESMKKEALK